MLGQPVAESPTLAAMFTFSGEALALMLIAYGFIASVLPVWLLLAPRDYLSTFLKIGTILGLAIGIFIVMPELKMPAVTQFVDGTGPVFAGTLFPFLFITIACGAVSGFHALISSGTTPKMLENESADPRHRLRRDADGNLRRHHGADRRHRHRTGRLLRHEQPARRHRHHRRTRQPPRSPAGASSSRPIADAARAAMWREAPSCRAPAARRRWPSAWPRSCRSVIGGNAFMAFWYHFAILFEALFILTTIDAGTRVGRFMIQDLLGQFMPALRETQSWTANLFATTLAVSAWGYFLYQGVVDPLGGINTLWPLFGIANQMLAAIALILCTVVLFRMKRERYAWITIVPAVWLLVCTLTAGWQKVFHEAPAIGFLAQANRFSDALAQGKILAPAKSIADMHRIVFANYLDAALCAVFMAIVVAMIVSGVIAIRRALATSTVSTHEVGYDPQDLGTARA